MHLDEIYPSLEGGRKLPLVESFYTIQGEGFHSGKPAFFIRLGGCDVGCRWCDSKESWNPDRFPPVSIEKIVREAAETPARSIVITGGEPMNYPLDPLCSLLKEYGLEIFVETSGSSSLSGKFDWVCLSPKKNKPPKEEFYVVADELKVIIEDSSDFAWAEENRNRVLQARKKHSDKQFTPEGIESQIRRYTDSGSLDDEPCLFYLQPEWSKMKEITAEVVEYVKQNPMWNISMQAHKFLHIP